MNPLHPEQLDNTRTGLQQDLLHENCYCFGFQNRIWYPAGVQHSNLYMFIKINFPHFIRQTSANSSPVPGAEIPLRPKGAPRTKDPLRQADLMGSRQLELSEQRSTFATFACHHGRGMYVCMFACLFACLFFVNLSIYVVVLNVFLCVIIYV